MVTMQFTVEQARALLALIETATRKGRASEWWRKIVEPLAGPIHEQLKRAVSP